MLNDVMNAIGRYGCSQEQGRLKYQLKTVRAAAQKLAGAMPKLGSKEYIKFSDAIFQIPPDAFTERSRGFFDLPTTLQMISAGADDALKKLRGTREGTTATTDFAIRLARAWVQGTGEQPGVAGDATYQEPVTAFGKFLKITTGMLPDAAEFESGFADLIRHAARVVKVT